MNMQKWQQPVKISIENKSSETVTGPFEAVHYLTESWPERSSVSFIQARNACRGAVAGRIDPEIARARFVAAVEAAKMRVH